MKISILLFAISVFFGVGALNAQWESVESGTTTTLLAVHVISDEVAFVAGSGGMLRKTMNGGDTWSLRNSDTSQDLWCFHFINSTVGFAVGNGGVLTKTTDGGETWQAESISGQNLRYVYFYDENLGFIGANAGLILKTVDGGDSWNAVDTDLPAAIYDIEFFSNTHGIALGFAGEIIETLDGGESWNLVDDITTSQTGVMYAFDDGLVFAAGANGSVLKSTDYGANWADLNTNSEIVSSGIFFTSPQVGYVTGGDSNNDGNIISTSDGGQTWSLYETGTPRLYKIGFSPSGNVGFTAGNEGTILRFTVPSAIQESSEEIQEENSTIVLVYPNPANDYLTVQLPNLSEGSLINYQIRDNSGKVSITGIEKYSQSFPVNIDRLAAGKYFLQVFADKKLIGICTLIKN